MAHADKQAASPPHQHRSYLAAQAKKTLKSIAAMATPSAIPKAIAARDKPSKEQGNSPSPSPSNSLSSPLPKPKFRLEINNLRHPASLYFIKLIPDLASTLETALTAIIRYLYTPPSPSPSPPHARKPTPTFTPLLPPTRSVTVLLRDISGVAYTTAKELDNDHKEIHISLAYIQHCQTSKADARAELVGVLTHELVHCYQYASPPIAGGSDPDRSIPSAPGGLVEGVADFVRLKAGLAPPHWKAPASAKDRAGKWDQGYEHTAYFLAWLEDVRVGEGAVGMLNDRLCRVGYVGEEKQEDGKEGSQVDGGGGEGFWKGLFGAGVDELWDEYGRYLGTG